MEPLNENANAAPRYAEVLGVLCWLLKDLGWCLLLGPLSWPMALMAICIESRELLQHYVCMTKAELVHNLAFLIWLLSNAIWMTGELTFAPSDERGRYYPWFHGPYAGDNVKVSGYLLHATQFGLVSGLTLLGAFYLYCLPELFGKVMRTKTESPANDHDVVFGWVAADVYQIAFVGPWIMKDLFWTCELLYPALGSAFIVFAMVIDYLRRYGDRKFVAEFFWVLGNTIWILAELQEDDAKYWPRLCAASSLFVGTVITLNVLMRISSQDTIPTERSKLLVSDNRKPVTA